MGKEKKTILRKKQSNFDKVNNFFFIGMSKKLDIYKTIFKETYFRALLQLKIGYQV